MGAEGDFECLRCATCCRNILECSSGVKRGLPLTEKEATLFPKEVVSPKLAVGVAEPNVVILYQLNVNVCPYVNAQNECGVYEERPLICRSFPIVAGAISNRCRVFSYRKVGVSYSEPYPMKKQLEASKKLSAYTQNRVRKLRRKGLKFWEYNLNTGTWLCRGLVSEL